MCVITALGKSERYANLCFFGVGLVVDSGTHDNGCAS